MGPPFLFVVTKGAWPPSAPHSRRQALLDAATCSQAVRLIPCPFVARSMRFKSAASNRILTVVFPASCSAIGGGAMRDAPAPEMKAAAFSSELAGFTAWSSLIVIVHLNCAASYFRSWVGMPIKWRGTSRRPIPENWHFIGARSLPYHLAGNCNAAHPVNAILNYAYAVLESEIRINAISDGCDPTVGTMHEGNDGSSKFIFDLMEPERPRVDRAVLDFVKGHAFDPADFVIRTDGVCRLNPEMIRLVVTRVFAKNS